MNKVEINRATDSTRKGVLPDLTCDGNEPTDVLRIYLASITGLDKTKVRKRWQPKGGTQPKIGEDWSAIGITSIKTDGTPYQKGFKPDKAVANDNITKTSFQSLKCVATFYGGNAFLLADTFREGIQVTQNNRELKRYGLTVQSVADDILRVPELVNSQWVDGFSVVFTVGRSVTRTYGVRSIASADVEFITDERGKL